ncbi:MAG: peptidase, partial [Solirubrobacterales bacterium]
MAALASVALILSASAGSARASDAGGHVPSADDRYSLANGCFVLRSLQTGGYAAKGAGGYVVTAAGADAAEPFRMQATDLGRYLLYGSARDFLTRAGSGRAVAAGAPGNAADWTVEEDGGGFRIVNEFTGHDLVAAAAGTLATVPAGNGGAAGLFGFEQASGCADYPEVEVNVDGPLPSGGSPSGPVRGTIETHMHQMAYEFLSTKLHCGKPWHRFGAPSALRDCQDHINTNGCSAILETALSGTVCHDPGGWPTFNGWPDHKQLTHEQSYYKWLERSWRAGLRIFVNLAVENRVLCELYKVYALIPFQNCNEMQTVRRELAAMRDLERYIDAQNGGPGEGWYRIVGSPAEARQVIADGKLAVIPGMEVSEPFGCRLMQPGDVPLCTEQGVRNGLDELYDLGVRQLELVNKFDNALTGVAGDSGTTGTITNLGNLASAGTFWDYETCTGVEDPEHNHDRAPLAVPHNDDQLIANGLDVLGDLTGITLPIYGPEPQCNQRGLTNLGEIAIRHLSAKGMIFDPDHMSVLARDRALDVVEELGYPGATTSHSWSTDNALPRISRLGGLIGPAAKSPSSFVDDWVHVKTHGYDQLNPYLFGFGYGADMNGFASQGEPLPAGSEISYPFTSPIDPSVTVDRQKSGTHTFDINTDGTAHYGLYADWTEGVRVAGGDEIIDDLANGAEAYLQMWERTVDH